jgi:hypothetical protein
LIAHLDFRAAIPLSILTILYSLSSRIYFYGHVVERINKSFQNLLGRRLKIISSLTFLARLGVLGSTVPTSLSNFALYRLHITISGVSLGRQGFICIGKRIGGVWPGFRFNQLRHRNNLALFLSLYEIGIVVTGLIRCVL